MQRYDIYIKTPDGPGDFLGTIGAASLKVSGGIYDPMTSFHDADGRIIAMFHGVAVLPFCAKRTAEVLNA